MVLCSAPEKGEVVWRQWRRSSPISQHIAAAYERAVRLLFSSTEVMNNNFIVIESIC